MNESRSQLFDCYNTLKYLNGSFEASPSLIWFLSAKAFAWDLILPIICLLGSLTNLFSFLLFYNYKSHFKHEIYTYLSFHSLIELIYTLLSFLFFASKSKYILGAHYCQSFAVKLFELYSHIFLTSILAQLMVFIELVISVKRLLMIFKLNLTVKISLNKTIAIYFLISILIHLPLPFKFRIVRDELNGTMNNPDHSLYTYKIVADKFTTASFLNLVLFIPAIVRGIILPILLLMTNLIIFVEFKKSFWNKSRSLSIKTNRCKSLSLSFSSPLLKQILNIRFSMLNSYESIKCAIDQQTSR